MMRGAGLDRRQRAMPDHSRLDVLRAERLSISRTVALGTSQL